MKYCTNQDLLRWCWEDKTIREIARSTTVWKGRWIAPDSLCTLKILEWYRPFIDSIDLSSASHDIINAITGYEFKQISFKGNTFLCDSILGDFLKKNGRHVQLVDVSNCLNLTNKSLYSIGELCTKIEQLCISGGLFTLGGLSAINESQIKRLAVANCLLLSSENILTAVPAFKSLRCLDLSQNSSVNYSMLCSLLAQTSATLKTLDVRGCEELTGFQIKDLESKYPHIKFFQDARIYDDSIESIRAYLLAMIRVN